MAPLPPWLKLIARNAGVLIITYLTIEGALAIYHGYAKPPRIHLAIAALFWTVIFTFVPKAERTDH